MPRQWIRALTGCLMLPVYLVASNCCLLGDSLDRGCGQEARSHDGCVNSLPDPEHPHDSDAHHSEPTARDSPDQDRPEGDHAAPCCNWVANALLPGSARVAVALESASFDAVIPQIATTPTLVELGVAATFSSESPPTRAAPSRRSRAPPLT